MAYRSGGRMLGMFYVPGFPPGVKWLLIGNSVIFILGYFVQFVQVDLVSLFGLIPARVLNLYLWQLVTYMFLHGSFGHIIWNMLGLWMFGTDLERQWGTRRFLEFYFFCGIGAGLTVVLLNFVLPWGNPNIPTIGASGAIFGILLANAVLFPDRTILWGFLIPIQMKWFVLIMGAITLLSSFQVNGVSAFAHLGGMLFGYFWLRKPRKSSARLRTGPKLSLRQQWNQWKLRRRQKQFEVYMRRQGRN